MRGMQTLKGTGLGVALAGALLVAVAACGPPVDPGGGPSPPTTAGGPGLPNTPNGQTFLSADGNWVVYHHGSERLAMVNPPGPTCPRPANTNTQIYRTNLVTGATELVSKGVDGCYANDESSFPDVSAR